MGATWDEIDLDKEVWTIPAGRMKAENEHRVPLTEDAISILKEMQDIKTSDYDFSGMKRNRPLSGMAFLQLLKRVERGDLTAHGFRATFRDWAAERTNYPRDVAEMALAHTIKDKAEAAYRRGDLFDKRRHMMDDWATYCATVPEEKGDNVVSINDGR